MFEFSITFGIVNGFKQNLVPLFKTTLRNFKEFLTAMWLEGSLVPELNERPS